MSRSTKKRASSELDDLKSENKELRSINKSLNRELKKLNKELKVEFNQEELIKEEHDDKNPKRPNCPHCTRAFLITLDLGKMKMLLCEICNYRVKVKNG